MSNSAQKQGRSATRAAPNHKSISNNNNNNPMNSPPKKKRRVRKARPNTSISQVLAPCSRDYFQALVDPFSYYSSTRPAPCYPDLLDTPSLKLGYRARGVIDIPSTGWAFIVVNPFYPFNTTTPVYPNAAAVITNGAYSSTSFPSATVITSGNANVLTIGNGPYSFGEVPNYRAVAMAVRVRYTGTELNRGGRIIPAFLPSGRSLAGINPNTLLANDTIHSEVVDRRWHGTFWRPTLQQDTVYRSVTENLDASETGIAMSGVPGTGQFEYEILWYHEYLPTQSRALSSLSKSDSDITGLSHIRDYVASIASSDVGQQVYEKGIGYMRNKALQAATSYITGGLTIEL
jgi:hypothetical protein